jgi:hypothetical protein
MGMPSGDGAAPPARPKLLLAAAIVLAAEAAALLAYTIINVVDIVTDNSYQVANGAALVILQAIVVVGIGWIAIGVKDIKPWTRTPAVMTQALAGVLAIILLQAHQYDWGAITLVLAAAGLAGLLAPASLQALARPPREPEPAPDTKPPAKGTQGATGNQGTQGAKNTKKTQGTQGNPARSGNPAKRNPAGKPVSRQS